MRPLDTAAAPPGPPARPTVWSYGQTWLAPTPLDRARLVEMTARLEPAMRFVGVAWLVAAVAVIVGGHVNPVWPLLPVVVGAASGPFVVRVMARSRRPEIVDAAHGLLLMTVAGFSAGMTGGSHSPIVILVLIGELVGAARSTLRVSTGIAGVSLVVLTVTDLLASSHLGVAEVLRLAAFTAGMAGAGAIGRALVRVEREVRQASETDPLTGLLTRVGLPRDFEEMRARAERDGTTVCLVLFDLDHFKAINDHHGHDVGDEVLREAGRRVAGALRRSELVYRTGGEEFAVLIPGVDREGGVEVADRIRSALSSRTIGGLSVTASFGVSLVPANTADFLDLYRHADRALYQSKHRGRNRVSSDARLRTIAA